MFLLLLLVAVVSAVGLTGHGASVLAARRARGMGAGPVLHALAAFAGAAVVALYAWGLLHVTGAVMESDGGAGSAPAPPCRMPGYLPLGFVCETTDGADYTSDDVPGYVNPATAVASAVGTGCASESPTRAAAGGGRR
ncbi:hypothetical protein [Streptomyces violaceorubidus]|uniref:Integral membrane protein n=1 Tax=Streptomyces violaceorubidus TaxID=284042 RepID=A0ABV1SY17_9ACTN